LDRAVGRNNESSVVTLLLIQSDEFANVGNWRTKEYESEMNFIWADDSV